MIPLLTANQAWGRSSGTSSHQTWTLHGTERRVWGEHCLKTQLVISLAHSTAPYQIDVLSEAGRHVSSVSQPLTGVYASSIPSSKGKQSLTCITQQTAVRYQNKSQFCKSLRDPACTDRWVGGLWDEIKNCFSVSEEHEDWKVPHRVICSRRCCIYTKISRQIFEVISHTRLSTFSKMVSYFVTVLKVCLKGSDPLEAITGKDCSKGEYNFFLWAREPYFYRSWRKNKTYYIGVAWHLINLDVKKRK